MAKSMTGFGRAKGEYNGMTISMELRSVNSRYLDINIRSPRIFSAFEADWRNLIKEEISRGKLELSVRYANESEDSLNIKVDLPRVKAYKKAFQELSEVLDENTRTLLGYISSVPDIFRIEEELQDEESLKAFSLEVLQECLEDFSAMREREGKMLKEDMLSRTENMKVLRDKLAGKAKTIPDHYRKKLLQRVEELLGETREEYYDGQRIAAEVAIFADKADITEELVRLESHIRQFSEVISNKGPKGKKLDFIIQEMNREANTIASKSQDVEMTRQAVEMKGHIEQLREQVQNIE